jgi:hypothetical protein
MAKFNWGRALTSAGNSLQDYFMQQDAERRRQEDIARRQQEYDAENPMVAFAPDFGLGQGMGTTMRMNTALKKARLIDMMTPEAPKTFKVQDIPGARRKAVVDSDGGWHGWVPEDGPEPPDPRLSGFRTELLPDGTRVLVDRYDDGTEKRGGVQFPSQGGGGTGGPKPQWFDPYGQPRYTPMTEADKLYYMIDHGFQTAGALAGGKQDWSTVLVDPLHINDIDEFDGGKFYNTRPGFGRLNDSELKDEDVRKKFEDYINSSADPDMAYVQIVRSLKRMKADPEAIRRVLPEYHGLTFDDIRARANARAQQEPSGTPAQYPQALVDEAAKAGMRVGEYEGQIGAWDGAKFYPWEGE